MAAPINPVFIAVPAELMAAKAPKVVSPPTANSSGFKNELNHAAQRESGPKYSSETANKDYQDSKKNEKSVTNETRPAQQARKSVSHISAQDTNHANGLSREAQKATAKNSPPSDRHQASPDALSNEHPARSAGENLPLKGQDLPQTQAIAVTSEPASQQLSSEATFDKTALDVEISKLHDQVVASQLAVPLTQPSAELIVTQQVNSQPVSLLDGQLVVIGQVATAGKNEIPKHALVKAGVDLKLPNTAASVPAQVATAIPAVSTTDSRVALDQVKTMVSNIGQNFSQEQKSVAALSPLTPDLLAKTDTLNTNKNLMEPLKSLEVVDSKTPDLLVKTESINTNKNPIEPIKSLEVADSKTRDRLAKSGISNTEKSLISSLKGLDVAAPKPPDLLVKTESLNTNKNLMEPLKSLEVADSKTPNLLAKAGISNTDKSVISSLNSLDISHRKPSQTLVKAELVNATTTLSNLDAEAQVKPSSISLDLNIEKFAVDAAKIQPARPEIDLGAKLVPLNVKSPPALIERSTSANVQLASPVVAEAAVMGAVLPGAVLPGLSASESESDKIAPLLNKAADNIAGLKSSAVVDAKPNSPLNLPQNSQINDQQAIGVPNIIASIPQGAQASAASLVKSEIAPKQSQLQALANVISESSAIIGPSNTANASGAQAFAPQPLVPASTITNPAISPDVNLINQQSVSLNKALDKMRAGIDTADLKSVLETVDPKSTVLKTVNPTESLQQLSSLHTGLRNASPVQMQMPPSTPPGNPNWARAVADKVYIAASQNLRVANIQLDPPELGALQIRLQVTGPDQQMSVTFTSPHAAVRDVLEQQIPRLREMLAEQGINLGESSVNDQGKDKKQPTSDSESASSTGYANDSDLENPAHSLNTQGTLALVDFYA